MDILAQNKQETVKEKLWTKDFILINITNLLSSIVFVSQNTIVTLYSNHIGGNNITAGLVATVLTISALLCRPVFGYLLDRKGRKLILITGLAIMAAVSLIFNWVFSILLLFIMNFIRGIGFSGGSTACSTIVSDIVPSSRLSEGIGYYSISLIMGMALGPVVGLYIVEKYSFSLFFICCFVIGLLSLVAGFLVGCKHDVKIIAASKSHITGKVPDASASNNLLSNPPKKGKLIEKAMLPASLLTLMVYISFSSIMTFLPLCAMSRGIEDIGMFFTVYAGSVLVVRVFMGILSKRIGDEKIMIPGMAFLIFTFIVLAYAKSLPAFLAAGVGAGIGFGIVQPILNTIFIRVCSQERRGAANAIYFASTDSGMGIGSLIWGFTAQTAGYISIYLGSSVLNALGIVLFSRKSREFYGKAHDES